MSNPKRKRTAAYALRSLLSAVVLFAAFFAYLHFQELNRRKIVEEIKRHNGTVDFAYSSWLRVLPARQIEKVSLPFDSLSDFDATKLRNFPKLTKIELIDIKMTDESGRVTTRIGKMTMDATKHGDIHSTVASFGKPQRER